MLRNIENIPTKKIPSNVPAPPILSIWQFNSGVFNNFGMLRISAPIRVPIVPMMYAIWAAKMVGTKKLYNAAMNGATNNGIVIPRPGTIRATLFVTTAITAIPPTLQNHRLLLKISIIDTPMGISAPPTFMAKILLVR